MSEEIIRRNKVEQGHTRAQLKGIDAAENLERTERCAEECLRDGSESVAQDGICEISPRFICTGDAIEVSIVRTTEPSHLGKMARLRSLRYLVARIGGRILYIVFLLCKDKKKIQRTYSQGDTIAKNKKCSQELVFLQCDSIIMA